MSLTGSEVELSSEGPTIRNIAGVDAEYRSHPDSSPSLHIPTGATFHYAVGQSVSLSAESTAVTIREGNIVETLLGGQDIMKCHIPCGSDGVRDTGGMMVLPYSWPIVIEAYSHNPQWSHRRRDGNHGVQHPVYAFPPEFGCFTRSGGRYVWHIKCIGSYVLHYGGLNGGVWWLGRTVIQNWVAKPRRHEITRVNALHMFLISIWISCVRMFHWRECVVYLLVPTCDWTVGMWIQRCESFMEMWAQTGKS